MTPLRASFDLPATAHAVKSARDVVGAVLAGWHLADLSDDAQLIVSELVTNVLRHAPGPESYELDFVRRANGVQVGLADGSSVRPVVAELDHTRTTGRGMRVVEHLASTWGVDEYAGGKRVWVVLDRA